MKMEQLGYFGIPSYIINIWKNHYSDTLLPVQEKAIRHYNILQKNFNQIPSAQPSSIADNLMVISPSSSGKTLVAEMAALKEIISCKKVIFLVPLRVLAEEKYKHFLKLYQPIGLKVKMSSSDHRCDDRDIINGNFHIAVIVYEKFYYLQLQYPQFLDNVSLLIADEIQLINDPQRGPSLENNFNFLRAKNPHIRIMALSAFTENVHFLSVWLNAIVLFSPNRPIELRKGIIRNGIYKYTEHNTEITGQEVFFNKNEVRECNLASYLIATLKFLLNSNETNLIFFPTRREARMWSRWLAEQFHLPPASNVIHKLNTLEDSTSREELLFLLQNSIAYHCAALSRIERHLIEEAVQMGEIKIICATETLSMGINLPVNNVILTGQKVISKIDYKHLERAYYKRALTIWEVENMGGRAGRFNRQGNFGRIIFLAPSLIELTAYQQLYFNSPTQVANLSEQYFYPAFQENAIQVQDNYSDTINSNYTIPKHMPGNSGTAMIPVKSGILEEKPIKVEYDIMTFFLHCIAQGYNSVDDINNIEQETGNENGKYFWNHRLYKKISTKKIAEFLRKLENGDLIKKHHEESYLITGMGSLIIARGICYDTYIHFLKWLNNCYKNDISELEILFLIATSGDGREFTIPLPRNRITKKRSYISNNWQEYLRMKMLSQVFELGEEHKPIFQANLEKDSPCGIDLIIKNNPEKYLAIKKTLLMFDWISSKESREIEECYGILNGHIQKIGEGFFWLTGTLAAIAEKIGWGKRRIADLKKIYQLSERLITGIEPAGLDLARLQIPDLSRTYIQRLVQEGYNDKQYLLEIDTENFHSILPESLIHKIKQCLTADKPENVNTELVLNKSSCYEIDNQLAKNNYGNNTRQKKSMPVLEINKDRPDRIFFFKEAIAVNIINFQLVSLLANNQGKMLSYDEIIDNLWPDDEDATYHRLWYHLGKMRSCMEKIIKDKNISDLPGNYVKENILRVFPGRGLLLDEKVLVKI
jgi:helicase